jgi:hypothetical protein
MTSGKRAFLGIRRIFIQIERSDTINNQSLILNLQLNGGHFPEHSLEKTQCFFGLTHASE